jgi:hypothetical protein
MPQVIAAWIERFAIRSIELHPGTTPLEAVRAAVSTFPETSELKPEEAAEVYAAKRTEPVAPGTSD